jgi:serine/threonine-protein kinase
MAPAAQQKRPGRAGEPANPFAIDRELGPYVLLERLGRGAQGDVWKAARRDLPGELVALKILNPGLKHNPARLAQFRREAERGTRLTGPSLLNVYELREIDGHIFIAMPYVKGTPLHEVIRCRQDYLAGEETGLIHALAGMNKEEYHNNMIRVITNVARALALVHDQSIAHRDIKPANILLDDTEIGGAYLCDFGLGRDLEVATADQMRDGAGTPMYMAPERLLRHVADEVKCDIYSLGVTTFEALTLSRPFEIPDHICPASIASYLAAVCPRRPSEFCPSFPEELEEIITKAMAPDPSRRFGSARELASRLERYGLRSSSRFSRTPVKTPHWARLGPSLAEPVASNPQTLATKPAPCARRMIKLLARPASDSVLDYGARPG